MNDLKSRNVHTVNEFKIIGIDLAKRNFHIVALNAEGAKKCAYKTNRADLISSLKERFSPECTIAMEACSGSHYWARELKKEGFKVKLLKTIDVKAYARTRQKNDTNDALAIAKTARDPDLRPVHAKSLADQEICLIHKLRRATIQERVRKTNALISHLHEFGFVPELSKTTFARAAETLVLEAYQEGKFTQTTHDLLIKEAKDIQALLLKEKELDRAIEQSNANNECAKNLQTIPGIGPIISSIISTFPIASYENARDFAASLGLVPSQRTTGGVIQLGRISKKGCRYTRTMLIQGARCILMGTSKGRGKEDAMISWAYRLWKRKGYNVACVALANKLARLCYGCTIRNKAYQVTTASA